jgi:hypothetical protein
MDIPPAAAVNVRLELPKLRFRQAPALSIVDRAHWRQRRRIEWHPDQSAIKP